MLNILVHMVRFIHNISSFVRFRERDKVYQTRCLSLPIARYRTVEDFKDVYFLGLIPTKVLARVTLGT